MELSRDFFDRFHRAQKIEAAARPEERFAGANARIPADVQTVLDVGCGGGEFLRWLPDSYWKVGLDFSYEAVIRAGKRTIQGTVGALPFAPASFDLVTCFEVLEHLPYQMFPHALRELERVSRKYIIVSVPNEEVLDQSLVWCTQCSCAFHPSWHVRSFDPAALGSLFSGFRMVECRQCGPLAQYGATRLAGLAVLLARLRPSPAALCPQCGYSEDMDDHSAARHPGMVVGPARRQRGGSVGRSIARRVLFRAWRPYWLLAVYARTADNS